MPASGESRVLDPIAEKLRVVSQNILVIVFGLLPLIFLPVAAAPLLYTKIFLVIIGLVCALVLFCLSVLRSGEISWNFSYSLIALWGVALIAFLAALLSGDLRDALIGDEFSVHSAAFIGLLALTASIWSFVRIERIVILRLFILLSASTIVLVLFHVIRLIFGTGALSFGVFQSSVSSPIGSWNDLALFFGLAILLSLVAIEQLKLSQSGRALFIVVTAFSLVMLAVINFFAVWLVLGLVSLVIVVYTLSKGRTKTSKKKLLNMQEADISSLVLSLVVSFVAVVFIVGGSAFAGFINKYTHISFIEVRPSIQATADIARGVYSQNAFLGIGPNRFADAWRLYKDQGINTTVFWNTDFNAGSGYVTTFFVTMGALGGIAWVLFLGLFFYKGTRNLLRASDSDRIWYFIGVASFVSAVYIWVMSVIYVPGPVILLLGAACTGLSIVSLEAMGAEKAKTFSITANRRAGFVLTLVVIAVIIGSVGVLYNTGRHYAAAYAFDEAGQMARPGTDISAIEAKLNDALSLSQNDKYVRKEAEYQLAKMNSLLAVQSPTQVQQQQFQDALVNGVNSGKLATQYDSTDPAGWTVLGNIYALLVSAKIEGAYDRAHEALTKARDLDPKNPLRYLALAQLEARANNLDDAKKLAEQAVQLKPNYSDGLYFLTQLDILAGNVDDAIKSAQAIISIEPQNPARYYQLGILLSAKKDTKDAASAFERAVALDPNYANALYFLALSYDTLGRSQEARTLLKRVLTLNPGNQGVTSLIQAIDTYGSIAKSPQGASEQPAVSGEPSVQEEDGTVTTSEQTDSSLINQVNTAPSGDESELSIPADSNTVVGTSTSEQ